MTDRQTGKRTDTALTGMMPNIEGAKMTDETAAGQSMLPHTAVRNTSLDISLSEWLNWLGH